MKPMLSAVAALVLSQDNTVISREAGQTSVATAKGSNPATDTYPGSVPPDAYVLTDAGIDTTCTDIDFEDADVTVSNLGGTDHCCTWCDGSASSGYLCCPTIREDGGMVRAPPPPVQMSEVSSQISILRSTRACTAPQLPASVHRARSGSRPT